ncbi:SRPBCC family protein [Patescibacteria group bacterium]|nr:SRPBCC family protein [Patescibacteria group bacterium]MBU1890475.1 SRPBCC family protein [Patescibacteria group bacterium]
MKENKVSVVINKPVREVFEFTTDPRNTHLWVQSIKKEVADEYPPKVGTIYKNRGDDDEWRVFKVSEFEPNKSFIITEGAGNFSVKYTYKEIDDKTTELIYLEWVIKGELKEMFSDKTLQGLKEIIEKS